MDEKLENVVEEEGNSVEQIIKDHKKEIIIGAVAGTVGYGLGKKHTMKKMAEGFNNLCRFNPELYTHLVTTLNEYTKAHKLFKFKWR